MTARFQRKLLALAALLLCSMAAEARTTALVAIIIDDIGYNSGLAERALNLPGPVSYGILPALPGSELFARSAREKKRDVLLHLPMESIGAHPLGPGGINVAMNAGEIQKALTDNLLTVPGAIGISNHMGSRFTSDLPAMQRLLSSMKTRDKLAFIDSLTTSDTKSRQLAKTYGIPFLSRDVFLDNDRDPEKIGIQFEKLLDIAKKRGQALAIGHPYPETLEFLEQRLHALNTGPVRLVPVSLLLNRPPEK